MADASQDDDFVWEFEEYGEWFDIWPDVCEQLTRAYKTNQTIVQRSVEGLPYMFDLKDMTQTNISTNYVRSIRMRVGEEIRMGATKLRQKAIIRGSHGARDVSISHVRLVCESGRMIENNTLLGDHVAPYLIQTIKKTRNDPIRSLTLERTQIKLEEQKHIGKIVAGLELTNLKIAKIELGDEGIRAFQDSIKTFNSLQKLRLTSCSIGDEGFVALCESISDLSIVELDILGNCVTSDGVLHFCSFLEKNKYLTSLNLTKNKIGNDGVNGLFNALKQNNTLQELRLAYCGFDDTSILSECLAVNSTLTELNVVGNRISDDGARQIASVLHQSSLRHLNIRNNKIGRQVCRDLVAESYRNMENVTALFFAGSEVPAQIFAGIKLLGEGHYGMAFTAALHGGREVVCKISKGKTTYEDRIEMNILQLLSPHKNVLSGIQFCQDFTHPKLSTSAEAFVMPFHSGGSLQKYCDVHNPLSLNTMLYFSHGMCLGLQNLHQHDIIHRDIALRNYVLSKDFDVVIIDFGLARIVTKENPIYPLHASEAIPWLSCAPETLSKQIFSTKSDIWMIGIAICKLLNVKPMEIFRTPKRLLTVLEKIGVSGMFDLDEVAPKNGILRDSIVSCCSLEPDERPDVQAIIANFGDVSKPDFSESKEESSTAQILPTDDDEDLLSYYYLFPSERMPDAYQQFNELDDTSELAPDTDGYTGVESLQDIDGEQTDKYDFVDHV